VSGLTLVLGLSALRCMFVSGITVRLIADQRFQAVWIAAKKMRLGLNCHVDG
jgi:hypothetical protein